MRFLEFLWPLLTRPSQWHGHTDSFSASTCACGFPRRWMDRYVVSQIDVLSYFRTLEELNSQYSYNPRNISNMDESQIFQGKKRSRMKAVANVSAHQVYRMHATSSMLITTSATIAANGQALEPLLIVPRKTLPHEVLAEAEVLKMSLVYSESGWMTRCIFDDWVEHMFIPEAVSSGMVLTS